MSSEKSGKFSDLTFTISTDKAEFLPMEPVRLSLTVSNNTTSVIKGHSTMQFRFKYVGIAVKNESGQTKQIPQLSALVSRISAPNMIPIQQNQQFQVSEVFYNLHDSYSELGNYTIQATLFDAQHKDFVLSNPVTIKIVKPDGINAEAYNFLKKFQGVGLLLSGGMEFDVYTELSNKFPNTLYSDYSDYIIAKRYLFEKDYSKAEPILRHLSQSQTFIFKSEVEQKLARIEELRRQ